MRLAIHRGGKVAVSSRPLGRYPQTDFQSRDDKLEALWCASRKILELLETVVLQRVSTIPYPIHRINWLVYWNQTQVSTKLPMRASGCSWAPKKNPHEMDSEKGNVKSGRKIGCPQILMSLLSER